MCNHFLRMLDAIRPHRDDPAWQPVYFEAAEELDWLESYGESLDGAMGERRAVLRQMRQMRVNGSIAARDR